MEKFFPKTFDKMPLEMLLQAICKDLFLVFAGNKWRNVGFALIAQDLETNEVYMSGNLRPAGMKAMLENALVAVPDENDETNGHPSVQKPN